MVVECGHEKYTDDTSESQCEASTGCDMNHSYSVNETADQDPESSILIMMDIITVI